MGILSQFRIGDTRTYPEPSPINPEPSPEPEPDPEPTDTPSDPDNGWNPSEGIDVAVKDIIRGIEEELEFEEELMDLDQKVLRDLEKALRYIQDNRGLIDDLMRVKFPDESEDISHEDLEHEMQGIKKSYNVDPSSKQATQQLKQEMKEIHDLLKDALTSLKKKDEAIQKLIDYNSNLGEKIGDIDSKERQTLESAISNLDKCWEYFER